MQQLQSKKINQVNDKENFTSILRDVKNEDWRFIASLTQNIKEDFKEIPHFVELRSKIKSGIYHVDKELLIDKMLSKIFSSYKTIYF